MSMLSWVRPGDRDGEGWEKGASGRLGSRGTDAVRKRDRSVGPIRPECPYVQQMARERGRR